MDKKKLFSKKVIIPIAILVLVIALTSIFLVSKKSTNTNNSDTPIENVSQNNDIETKIQTDVLTQNVCVNYNGNYVFKAVADISFPKDISSDSEKLAYKYFCGSTSKNSFLYYLYENKTRDSKNEIITLVNGKYTKSQNNKTISTGLFFGNENKSYVFTEDENGTSEFNGKNHKIDFEISLNGHWLSNNILDTNDIIYIREKFYYDNIQESFIYVTYIYEMI